MPAPWGPYGDTVLRFPASAFSIDLRSPLDATVPARLAQLGLGAAFGVVTACNPLGAELGVDANRRLSRVLASVVGMRYPGAVAAHGGSADRSHEEPGWAIVAPLAELQALAAGFLQRALFWFDGERFTIVPVLTPGPVQPLPASPRPG